MDKNERIRLIVEKVQQIIDYIQVRQKEQLITLIYAQLNDLLEDIL